MILTFRPIKVWPPEWPRTGGKSSPFQASYRRTLDQLDVELSHLRATDVTMQVDASSEDMRLDGQLRANASVGYRGVILTVESRTHGTLTYPVDTFSDWQSNLRAITLGLEALRKVERYGIADRGQQYAGYRELGSGIAMGPGRMTADQAAAFLVEHGEWGSVPADPADLIGEPDVIAAYYRQAAKRLHPDAGGDPEQFKRLQEAKEVLGG